MSQNMIFAVIGLVWLIVMIVFLKDYVLGERKVKRKRGTPTLDPQTSLRRDN